MTGITKILLAGTMLATSIATAQAGGFSRGNADTDVLYEPGNFTMRSGVTIVSPQRSFTRHNDPALVGHRYTERYVVPSLAMKLQPFDALGCAGTFTQPYGADVNYEGRTTAGKLTEQFDVDEFALTCALRFDAGPGKLYLLGGVFHEKFDYSRTQLIDGALIGAPGFLLPGSLTLDGTDQGYRVGIGYDVPEIALRGQLMYRSGTSYGADGTFTIQTPGGPIPAPALGFGNLPQSVELKVQSGIAPGWLAFGSVKWTDWSVQEALIVDVPALNRTTIDEYNWRDGWTVTAGVGHAFNEQMSGLASITWDRGVATGYDLIGESWTLSLGGSLRDTFGGELRAGVGVSYLASVEAPLHPENQAVGSDWATGVSLGYRINW